MFVWEFCFFRVFFFFFNDTATTEIYTRPYTLSLHDALPICGGRRPGPRACESHHRPSCRSEEHTSELQSHGLISYAVFCLKKKNNYLELFNWPCYKHTITKQKKCKII